MSKDIDAEIQDILLNLVEYGSDYERNFGTSVDVSMAHDRIMKRLEEVQDKAFAEGVESVVVEAIKLDKKQVQREAVERFYEIARKATKEEATWHIKNRDKHLSADYQRGFIQGIIHVRSHILVPILEELKAESLEDKESSN